MLRRYLHLAALAALTLLLSGCGYNEIQRQDEQVKAAWSQVLNQYERRADLVPKLVSLVNAYMVNERTVLRQVTEARARTPLAINKTSCDRPGTNNHYSQCFLTRSLKRRRRSSQRRQPSLAQTDLPMLIMQPKMSRRQFLR